MATDPTALIMQLVNAGGNTANAFTAGQQQDLQNRLGEQQLQAGALQLQQATKQQDEAGAYQQATQAYIDGGSKPEELYKLAVRFPQQAEALKRAASLKDDAQKTADLHTFGSVYNALDNNKPDLAVSALEQRRDAEKAANIDTSELDQVISGIKAGDSDSLKLAKGYSLAQIYAHDPDKFGDAFGIGKDKGKKFSNTPQGDIYSTDTGEVTHAGLAKPVIKVVNGQIVQVSPDGNSPIVSHASGLTGDQIEQAALSVVPGATVTSRSRTPEHNKAVGGVSNSYHLTDQARDLTPPAGMSMDQFHAQLASSLPGMKVLTEGGHVHIQPIGPAPRFNAGGTKVLYTAPPKTQAGGDQALDNATLSMMADQYLAGDKTVFQNLGRGVQGGGNVVRLRKMVAQKAQQNGMSGSAVAAQMADFAGTMAAERASGTRTAQVELASTEAQRLIPLALQASDALPRNGFVPFAKAQQAIQGGTNNPALRRFVTANNALVNVYSRAVSPTGAPTVADKEHAREMLNTAYDQQSYRGVVSQMQQEIQAARAAPKEVRADLRGQVSSGQRPQASAAPTRTATNPKTGQRLGLINGQWVALK